MKLLPVVFLTIVLVFGIVLEIGSWFDVIAWKRQRILLWWIVIILCIAAISALTVFDAVS